MRIITDTSNALRAGGRRRGRTRLAACLAAASIAVFALAGCGSSGAGNGTSSGGGSASQPPAAAGTLATAHTKLGTVVVDGQGKTVYVYDHDTAGSGKSACTGACTGLWPALTTTSMHPTAKGITGTVGTIAVSGGQQQITLNGLPLYTYSGDNAAGDVNGQGVQGIWWAVSPAGKKISGTGGSGYSY